MTELENEVIKVQDEFLRKEAQEKRMTNCLKGNIIKVQKKGKTDH